MIKTPIDNKRIVAEKDKNTTHSANFYGIRLDNKMKGITIFIKWILNN